MKNTILIILMILVFSGCGKKTEQKQNPLPEKTHHVTQKKKHKTALRKNDKQQPVVTQNISQVVLRGTVLCNDDETQISNLYLSAIPRGLYKKKGNPGHFSGNIALDIDGNFILSNLVEATYTIKITSDNFHQITTNVYLCDKENFVDFCLVPFKHITVKGKVVYEKSNEPAPNITVQFVSLGNTNDLSEAITDINGKFSFQTFIKDYSIGTLKINEPGYAALKYNIYNNYPGEEIPLILKDVSGIKGVVKTPEGKPVSNVLVSVYYDYHYTQKFGKKNSFSKKLDKSVHINVEYKAGSATTSSGEFMISNVAAPAVYCFKIDSEDYFLPLSIHAELKTIKVNIGAVTETELIVLPKSKVFLKIKDEKVNPVLNYKLNVMAEDERGSDSYSKQVLLSTDSWYHVNIPEVDNNGKLSLTAIADDEKIAATNEIILVAGETNFITMVLSSKSQISGFVYYPDESPAIDAWISANVAGNVSYRNAHTDYLGYFEFIGLSVKSNDIIEVSVSDKTGNYEAETNLPLGAQDVEIYLSPPPKIFGNVSLDYSDNPATNFTISIGGWKTVAFHNNEGKFSINLSSDRLGTNFIYITSAGYAPRKIYFDFIKNKACNLGEIILSGKPATITGRVVDQNEKPIWAHVYLLQEDSEELNVRTYSGGKYIFTDLPIEPVKIRAHAFYSSAKSGVIHPLPNGITEVPDIVIFNTNAAAVEITFILPSGDYAAGAFIFSGYYSDVTDEKGIMKFNLPCGTHKNWRAWYDEKIYRTEGFFVSPDTKKIRVKLIESSKMKVTFFLDGKLMKKDYVRCYFNGKDVCEDIPDGTLAINNLPGKYVFYNEMHGIATAVDLYEGDDNIVNFTTENAALEVELPYKGSWQVDAMLLIDGAKAEVGSENGENDLSQKVLLKNIPAGEYELWICCQTPSAKTNFIMRATAVEE
jgi:CYTH domain-containing protein